MIQTELLELGDDLIGFDARNGSRLAPHLFTGQSDGIDAQIKGEMRPVNAEVLQNFSIDLRTRMGALYFKADVHIRLISSDPLPTLRQVTGGIEDVRVLFEGIIALVTAPPHPAGFTSLDLTVNFFDQDRS